MNRCQTPLAQKHQCSALSRPVGLRPCLNVVLPQRYMCAGARSGHTGRHVLRALPSGPVGSEGGMVNIQALSDLITSQAMEGGEKQYVVENIAKALQVPVATVKSMAFKQKALLNMDAAEVKARIEKVAAVVEVPYAKALAMCTIQPALITEDRQAEALKTGLRMICYDLKAPKDEIVNLIIENPSVLHGRKMRLSVADVAHLSMLREPRGRIAE